MGLRRLVAADVALVRGAPGSGCTRAGLTRRGGRVAAEDVLWLRDMLVLRARAADPVVDDGHGPGGLA